jgi:hypothetical protein
MYASGASGSTAAGTSAVSGRMMTTSASVRCHKPGKPATVASLSDQLKLRIVVHGLPYEFLQHVRSADQDDPCRAHVAPLAMALSWIPPYARIYGSLDPSWIHSGTRSRADGDRAGRDACTRQPAAPQQRKLSVAGKLCR